jgi:hypothetical protein
MIAETPCTILAIRSYDAIQQMQINMAHCSYEAVSFPTLG